MSTVEIPIDVLRTSIKGLLAKQGHTENDADIIADVLMYAELRGNNQGIVKLIAGALCPDPSASNISVVFESPVSAKVDGGQMVGMCVVHRSVEIAIAKANVSGIGIVGCSNYSSATGALGIWARDIARAGYIAIVMSQCPEMVAPQGSYEPIFGTNPLAIGIPSSPRPHVLDMATSACAWYGLVTAKEEGKTIPNDVAYDAQGNPTSDPAAALGGALRAFDRSYKGSHLALMVELLAGALTGASMVDKQQAHNWGSLVLAISPSVFGPDCASQFQASVEAMCNRVKNAKRLPSEADKELFLPGERGDQVEADQLQAGIMKISAVLHEQLMKKLAE